MPAAWECTVAPTTAHLALLQHLDSLGVAADHWWNDGAAVHLVLTKAEIDTLTDHGIDVTVGTRLKVRAERDDIGVVSPVDRVGALDFTSGFVTGYLDSAEVDARIGALAAAHPAWCSIITLPHPTHGYVGSAAGLAGPATVRALRITSDPTVRSRPGFLLVGGMHAREWMNPLVVLEFAEQLLANVDPASTDPAVVQATRSVTKGDILCVPVCNPDGLNFSVYDNAGWRKNRRPPAAPGDCPGVDDNRNFPVYFGGPGSSASSCSDAHHGPFALSEPETRNIAWLLEQFPNIRVGVDSHSFGNVLFRPQPGGGTFISSLPVSAADEAVYAGLEASFVAAVAAVNGTAYGTGTTSNHAGTSDEYMFFGHRVYGFDTECGATFQPPWADAAVVIDEVVAGMRALAEASLDLVEVAAPIAVVQCVDRTGSMVSLGYDHVALSNARRFVDLMSIGDSAGVVSFADPSPDPTATPVSDRALVEFPLTELVDGSAVAAARAAIDGIAFGGWTPIGAGLERGRLEIAAAGGGVPGALLLISDGYENRDPSAASVLSTWPAEVPVYTIALGPASDTALLSQIATQTGGVFQMSPTALDLYLVYNQMRADITDAGVLLNVIDSGSGDGGMDSGGADLDTLDRRGLLDVRNRSAVREVGDLHRLGAAAEWERFGGLPDRYTSRRSHGFDVEPGANRLTVTVADAALGIIDLALRAPSGRLVDPRDYGVQRVRRRGYANLVVPRPTPGRWEVTALAEPDATVVIGAILDTPLRIELEIRPPSSPREQWQVRARASWEKHDLGELKVAVRPQQLRLPDREQSTTGKNVTRITHLFLELAGTLPGGAPFHRSALRSFPH